MYVCTQMAMGEEYMQTPKNSQLIYHIVLVFRACDSLFYDWLMARYQLCIIIINIIDSKLYSSIEIWTQNFQLTATP